MDRSFQGLLISIILHVLLVVFLVNAKFPHAPVKEAPTEITLVEPKQDKSTYNNLAREKTAPKQFKDSADLKTFVSRRAKDQTVAHNADVNHGREASTHLRPNFAPQFNPTPPAQTTPHEESGEMPSAPKREYHPVQLQAVGQSGTAEYIPGIKEGTITAYSSDQFTFFAFFSRLNEAIRFRWVNHVRMIPQHLTPQQLQELSSHPRLTLIQMVLYPNGQIKDVYIDTSSGNAELDNAGLEALKEAAPYHNPPSGMLESDGLIHIPCAFELLLSPPGFG